MKHKDIRKALAPAFRDIVSASDLPKQFRPYQSETLLKAADWLEDLSGTPRAYVSHATGLGKTVEFAGMIRAAAELRSLVIVPTKTLLTQTLRELAQWSPGLLGHLSSMASILDRDGELIAIRGLGHSSIVITTDASFKRYAAEIKKELDPHLILRDECHWGYEAESVAALNQFKEPVIIGFSATPDYLTNRARGGYTPVTLENGQVLYGPRDKFAETHFQTLLDKRGLRWGIEEGYLAPMRWGLIDFDQVNLGSVRVVDGPDGPDFDKNELQSLLEKHWDVMCETIRRLYEQDEYQLSRRQVCATCPSVYAAQQLAKTIQSLGLSAACVHGGTPDVERNVILEAYRQNEIGFLSSVRVLREGWDAPNAEVCMMLTPTASRVFYEQPIGRVARIPDDGSPKVSLVLDAHFQGKTFHPLSAPALYAPPGSEIPVGDILIDKDREWGVRGMPVDAPLLPQGAKPRVVVVESYEVLNSQSSVRTKRGRFFEMEGVLWGSTWALRRHFEVSERTLLTHVRHLEPKVMIGLTGTELPHYPVKAVGMALAPILAKPRADKDGILRLKLDDEQDAKEYRTCSSYADLIQVGDRAVYARAQDAGLAAIDGRDSWGKPGVFYLVEDLDRACADLRLLPRIEREDGIYEHGGRMFATIMTLSERLDISRSCIKDRMAGVAVPSLEALDGQRKPQTLFEVEAVQKLCADLLDDRPALKKDGTISAGEEVIAPPRTLAALLGLKEFAVRARIRTSKLTHVPVKGRGNADARGYRFSEVAALCSDLMEVLPISSLELVIQQGGQSYLTTRKMEGILNVSRPTLQKLFVLHNVRWIWGRTPSMQRVQFYCLGDTQTALEQYKKEPGGSSKTDSMV